MSTKNNPPVRFMPAIALAKKSLFAERYILPQLGAWKPPISSFLKSIAEECKSLWNVH